MIVVRRGVAADAPEVVRLRAVMLAAMGLDVGPDNAPWRAECAAAYERLLAADTFATFVVDDGDRGLAACATGWIDQRLPGPWSDGRTGHLANVCTDPVHRRRGLARATVRAVMQWFADSGVRRVDLHATQDARGLYEAEGFAAPDWPAMTWQPPGR